MFCLQRHSSVILYSTFGISCFVIIACLTLYFYYVFVSFRDGRSAHPNYVSESSVMIIGFFAIGNGMIIFRLIGHSTQSYLIHSITQQSVTLLVVLQIGFFFGAERLKLFILTFPLPAFTMIACFLIENIFALYVSICTADSVNKVAQALHTGVHAFLGVSTMVIMFWNVTLMLAMMCVNPKHNKQISEIDYDDLLFEPGYMAILVSLYLLLILFILLIPFLRIRRGGSKQVTSKKNDIDSYAISKNVLRKNVESDEEDDGGDSTQGDDEGGVDADDEKESMDLESERQSISRTKKFIKRIKPLLNLSKQK